ncbi:lipopolysaccharide biosynthesis protein [Oceanobacillus sp. CF4.6]|uniref:lipopolysaccharide biosynthesis protein n=1 Tax=Oceanobacillus sp. CF4.6 TaxID=3373080 RepID=UPI003EE69CB6
MFNKLFKKFLSFSYGGVVAAVIGFIITMITTRVLSPEEFGKASMFTLFVSIFMIVAVFGSDQAFVRFYYEEEQTKRGALLYNCLKIAFTILVPILAIIILFRENLLNYLFEEYNLTLFIVLIFAVVIQVVYRFGTLVVRMQQKGNLFSLLQILNQVLILIGVIIFYLFIGGTYKILVFSTVGSLFILVLFLVYSQKKYWNITNASISNTRHSKLDIFSYSYPLMLTTAIMWIFEGMDKIAIRQWADFNELGLYSVAFKIIGLLAIIKTAFTTFWTPVAYENFEKNPTNTSFYANISKLVTFVMMIVAIAVIMMKDIMIMLFGSGYESAGVMLSFLVFIPVMYTISETTVIGINFYKKVKWHIFIVLIVCIVNFIGNWLLVPKMGGVGAAISTGLTYILFFTLRTVISLRYYKVNYGLLKTYASIVVLLTFASYTLLSNQPIHEQVVGLLAMLAIVLIYLGDIKKFIKIRKGVA